MSKEVRKKTSVRKKWILRGVLILTCSFFLGPVFWSTRPVPVPGFHCFRHAPLRETDEVRLLLDHTVYSASGDQRSSQQEIFDALLALIANAHRVVLIDMFLWNTWQGPQPERHRDLAAALAEALISRKRQMPELTVLAMTDPLNRIYNGMACDFFVRLAEAGVPVIFTDLDRLPDPNVWYARLLRFHGAWMGRLRFVQRALDRPLLPNPLILKGPRITLRQTLRLLLFKANHRKVAIADRADGDWQMLVGSFNPADGSSAHSNIALLLSGELALKAALCELDVMTWSAAKERNVYGAPPAAVQRQITQTRGRIESALAALPADDPVVPDASVEWLTEGAIRNKIIVLLDAAERDDEIRIAQFYLSDRGVIASIKAAARRGARLRLILDANRDAFGRKKNGIPNRPVARELHRLRPRPGGSAIEIRWAKTVTEQFHTKAMSVTGAAGRDTYLLLGSANWSRRNLHDFNLEANIGLHNVAEPTERYNKWFDHAWTNHDNVLQTLSIEAHLESGLSARLKALLYRFQEASGLSSF